MAGPITACQNSPYEGYYDTQSSTLRQLGG